MKIEVTYSKPEAAGQRTFAEVADVKLILADEVTIDGNGRLLFYVKQNDRDAITAGFDAGQWICFEVKTA